MSGRGHGPDSTVMALGHDTPVPGRWDPSFQSPDPSATGRWDRPDWHVGALWVFGNRGGASSRSQPHQKHGSHKMKSSFKSSFKSEAHHGTSIFKLPIPKRRPPLSMP